MNNKTKHFYWIKLKESFMTGDSVDFLMAQKNGSDYVVLYIMLCLKTANNNGRLESKIGEMIVPYDVTKIERECKYFSYETIVVALNLYQQIGLIYKEKDGCLSICNHQDLVGKYTNWSQYKQDARQIKRLENVQPHEQEKIQRLDNSWKMSNQMSRKTPKNAEKLDNVQKNVQIEYRDKEINNLLYSPSVCINNNINQELLCTHTQNSQLKPDFEFEKKHTKKNQENNFEIKNFEIFQNPSLEEIQNYIFENSLNVNPEYFFKFYESKNWTDANGRHIDFWTSKLLQWHESEIKNHTNKPSNFANRETERDKQVRLAQEYRASIFADENLI